MSTAEHWEMQISAALDGELDPVQTRELIDALATSPECRAFYLQARELQSIVESFDTSQVGSGRPGRRSQPPRTRRRVTIVAVAAVLLVGLAMPIVFRSVGPNGRQETVDVVLEEDAGTMTDDRFLELTLELLRADRRYRRLMMGVLDEVGTNVVPEEGATPTRRPRREYRLTRYDGSDLDRSLASARGEVTGQVY